jgi:F-type H+-transporting ATPase subunit delta
VADDSKASNVGDRYALALFDLAKDEGSLSTVEADLRSLKTMSAESRDLATLLASPGFSAQDKSVGLAAVAERAGFHATTRKFLGLVSANGRAAAIPAIIASFERKAAVERGAVSAEVTTAQPLTAAQASGLAAALRQALGKDPEIETKVDPALLGGIKVKVGSRLYDASLKSKLDQLKFALKRA